jgi:eukaryotic-like serine/threonine-protein kinase
VSDSSSRCGPYELLDELGRGGMATVYRARRSGEDGFSAILALKRLRLGDATDDFIQMLVEEARVMASLNHPNIVSLLDYGRDEMGRPYLVFEWIDGQDLRELVDARAHDALQMPWSAAAWAVALALRGLAAAHERCHEGVRKPIIHRDISPGNILVSVHGSVLLADFGLARSADRTTITPKGQLKGKLAYAAPELVQGARATERSDLYAAGVVLWEALAGEALFRGGEEFELMARILEGGATPLEKKRDGLPDELYDLVHRCMSLDPARRPKSARELGGSLETLLARHGFHRPEPLLAEEVRRARGESAS